MPRRFAVKTILCFGRENNPFLGYALPKTGVKVKMGVSFSLIWHSVVLKSWASHLKQGRVLGNAGASPVLVGATCFWHSMDSGLHFRISFVDNEIFHDNLRSTRDA